jgi:hypothetical protein
MECRICLGDDAQSTMLVPCNCRGTSAYIHERCLRTYMSYYPDRLCRVCREPMRHPWIDIERNLISAGCILIWAAVLLTLSKAPVVVKLFAYCTLCAVLTFHVRRMQLTYEITFACVAASFLLVISDPIFLPQTLFLTIGLLILLTMCLFSPINIVFLVLVFVLGITYSALFLVMVATHTDPAFTGLVLLALATIWMAFARPGRLNEV